MGPIKRAASVALRCVPRAATEEDGADLFAAYFADASKDRDRDVVYDETLGLAIESVRDGWTIEKLWATL